MLCLRSDLPGFNCVEFVLALIFYTIESLSCFLSNTYHDLDVKRDADSIS